MGVQELRESLMLAEHLQTMQEQLIATHCFPLINHKHHTLPQPSPALHHISDNRGLNTNNHTIIIWFSDVFLDIWRQQILWIKVHYVSFNPLHIFLQSQPQLLKLSTISINFNKTLKQKLAFATVLNKELFQIPWTLKDISENLNVNWTGVK